MPLESSSFQTPATDFAGGGPVLSGNVLDMQVLDPTEGNERTSLLEVDDEFDVQVTWQLTGAATTVTAGTWIVSLYSDDIDGVGTMNGLIAGPDSIPFTGAISPHVFSHTFQGASAHTPGRPVPAGLCHQLLAGREPEPARRDVRLRGIHPDQHQEDPGGDARPSGGARLTTANPHPAAAAPVATRPARTCRGGRARLARECPVRGHPGCDQSRHDRGHPWPAGGLDRQHNQQLILEAAPTACPARLSTIGRGLDKDPAYILAAAAA